MSVANKFPVLISAVVLLGLASPVDAAETRMGMDNMRPMSQPNMAPTTPPTTAGQDGMTIDDDEMSLPQQRMAQSTSPAAPMAQGGTMGSMPQQRMGGQQTLPPANVPMGQSGLGEGGMMNNTTPMQGMQQPQQPMGMGMMGMQQPTGQQMPQGQPMPMCMGMMGMPPMGQQMPQSQGSVAMGSSGTVDRIEGRIAFLQAELRITNAQLPQWNEFAVALRTNAQRMKYVQAMPQTQLAGGGSVIAGWLDQKERVLSSYLDGVRDLKATYARLYAALDEAQKKAADELVWPHFGM